MRTRILYSRLRISQQELLASVTAQSFRPSLDALDGITSGPVINVDNGQMVRSHVKNHGPPGRQAAAPENEFLPEDCATKVQPVRLPIG